MGKDEFLILSLPRSQRGSPCSLILIS